MSILWDQPNIASGFGYADESKSRGDSAEGHGLYSNLAGAVEQDHKNQRKKIMYLPKNNLNIVSIDGSWQKEGKVNLNE